MVQAHVELSESQAEGLKRLAERWNTSIPDAIRRAVDRTLASEGVRDPAEIRRRAAAAVGAFNSGGSDLSETHDAYLAEEAFR